MYFINFLKYFKKYFLNMKQKESNNGRKDYGKEKATLLLTRIIYFFTVEKGECILTHGLHCTHIYTITYNPRSNVTHKFIIN